MGSLPQITKQKFVTNTCNKRKEKRMVSVKQLVLKMGALLPIAKQKIVTNTCKKREEKNSISKTVSTSNGIFTPNLLSRKL